MKKDTKKARKNLKDNYEVVIFNFKTNKYEFYDDLNELSKAYELTESHLANLKQGKHCKRIGLKYLSGKPIYPNKTGIGYESLMKDTYVVNRKGDVLHFHSRKECKEKLKLSQYSYLKLISDGHNDKYCVLTRDEVRRYLEDNQKPKDI